MKSCLTLRVMKNPYILLLMVVCLRMLLSWMKKYSNHLPQGQNVSKCQVSKCQIENKIPNQSKDMSTIQ